MGTSFAQKQNIGVEVKQLATAECLLLAENKGVSAKEMDKFRISVRDAGGKVRVIKNNVAKLSFSGSQFELIANELNGPLIYGFSDDPVSLAKCFDRMAKDSDGFVVRVAVTNGAVLDTAQVAKLAKLPERDILLAQLLGALQAPISKCVGTMNGVLSKFVRTLDAYRSSKEENAS